MAGNSNGDLASCKKITLSTISFIASLVFVGYCFERTKPLASKICIVQYPVGEESAATLYGYGQADGITLLFYVAMALIITSGIEDIIQSLNWFPNNVSFSQQMTQIVFYMSSFLFGLYVLNKGKYDRDTFLNGFPDHNVPYLLKVFYLTQLAFLFQCFPQAMLQGLGPWESLTSLIEAQVLQIFLVASYAVNYTPMGTAVVMVHYAAKLLYQLTALSTDSRSLRSYVKLALFVAEQSLYFGAAIRIYAYADSRGHSLRCCTVAAAVISAAIEGLTIYQDYTHTGRSNGSGLTLLPTAADSGRARKGKRRQSKGRKGTGDRSSSKRKSRS